MHIIRLRDPWEIETVSADAPYAVVRLRRRFGCPTGLDPTAAIELVIDQPGGAGAAWLNNEALGPIAEGVPSVRYSLQKRLLPRNNLVLEFTATGAPPFREVRLEIPEEESRRLC